MGLASSRGQPGPMLPPAVGAGNRMSRLGLPVLFRMKGLPHRRQTRAILKSQRLSAALGVKIAKSVCLGFSLEGEKKKKDNLPITEQATKPVAVAASLNMSPLEETDHVSVAHLGGRLVEVILILRATKRTHDAGLCRHTAELQVACLIQK